jgi:hypothetical protein
VVLFDTISGAAREALLEKFTAGLQKVSAQLELNKPAPQTVMNCQ